MGPSGSSKTSTKIVKLRGATVAAWRQVLASFQVGNPDKRHEVDLERREAQEDDREWERRLIKKLSN